MQKDNKVEKLFKNISCRSTGNENCCEFLEQSS